MKQHEVSVVAMAHEVGFEPGTTHVADILNYKFEGTYQAALEDATSEATKMLSSFIKEDSNWENPTVYVEINGTEVLKRS